MFMNTSLTNMQKLPQHSWSCVHLCEHAREDTYLSEHGGNICAINCVYKCEFLCVFACICELLSICACLCDMMCMMCGSEA